MQNSKSSPKVSSFEVEPQTPAISPEAEKESGIYSRLNPAEFNRLFLYGINLQ